MLSSGWSSGVCSSDLAVAHPHLMPLAYLPQAVEQHAGFGDRQEGAAEFAVAFAVGAAGFDLSAELLAHHLLAVADAEDGEAAVEHRLRRARAACCGHRGGRTRQDHPLGLHPLERRLGAAERHDLAIDASLADAAGDELGDLTAEVDDQDGFGGGRGDWSRHGWPIKRPASAVQRSRWVVGRALLALPYCCDKLRPDEPQEKSGVRPHSVDPVKKPTTI